MDLRLIIFDVDGTLVDSQNEIVGAMTTAFEATGHVAPVREAILSIVGLSLPVAVRALAPHLPEDEVTTIVDGYRACFMNRRVGGATPPLYPGALDVLGQLHGHEQTLLGVATGKSRRGLVHLLEAHALDRFFVTRQVADDHPSKPHPSMLMACLRETGAAAGQGIMVGDTSFDIEMGRAAGFRTIGVTWGYHGKDRLHQAGADILVDRFEDMPAAMMELAEGT